MEATLEQIPRAGQLELTIQVSATVHYSAAAARRIAGRFVANEIAYLSRAGEPTLVMAETGIYWRVPIVLAFPTIGPVGSVGYIDVHVETGEFSITPEQIQEMRLNAEEKAARHSSASSLP
jgi:hypothetical protein